MTPEDIATAAAIGRDLAALLLKIGLLHDESDPGGLRCAALIEMAEAALAITQYEAMPRAGGRIQ